MAGRPTCVFALVWAAGACGGGQGVYDAAEEESAPVLAADYGFCTPLAQRSESPFVWCGALGGTCATSAACDFIDGGPAIPGGPLEIPAARGRRLTVFLRMNCRDVVSGAALSVDGVMLDTLGIGPPGLSFPIETGPHTIAAESPEGFAWESFPVSVPARGLVQPLTCR